MSLIDGKYEIVSQEIISSRETVFKALAPDGNDLNIIWYEFNSLADEQQFEQFRKLIRVLRKENLAAVYDIVSRPGANYIVWLASNNLAKANTNQKITDILSSFGYSSNMADIRSKKNKRKIYYLSFNPEELVVPSLTGVKPSTPKKSFNKKPIYVYGSSLLLFLTAFFIILNALQQGSNNRTIVLDNLLGQNVNQASKLLNKQNLKVILTPISSNKLAGQVISMEPKSGSEIRPFYRTVHLSYAAPAEQLGLVKVINLQGLMFNANTSKLLEENSLSLGKIYYIQSNKKANTILAQSNIIGNQVSIGTTIDILVSTGSSPKLTFVPNLLGMSLEDAIFFAGLSGLTINKVYERSSLSKGIIIGQSIAAFEPIALDSSLTLYISEGIDGEITNTTNITPALVGLSLNEAKRIAPNYQFKITEINTSSLANGIVSQNPAIASSNSSNIINLVVNSYIPPIAIPIPNITTQLRKADPRSLEFAWATENNISLSDYEVLAILADGRTISVQRGKVKGGEIVSGAWLTNNLGPVRFKLYLNGFQYSIEIIRN